MGQERRKKNNSTKEVVLWKKSDLLILLIPVLLAGLLFAFALRGSAMPLTEPMLEIRKDERVIGRYPLKEDREIPIGDGMRCQIREGEAFMVEADCPDQICVHTRPIRDGRRSIVCLPNRILLRIVDGEDAEEGVDSIAE